MSFGKLLSFWLLKEVVVGKSVGHSKRKYFQIKIKLMQTPFKLIYRFDYIPKPPFVVELQFVIFFQKGF